MGHTLNESLPLHVKQTWSHFLPRIRSQHVLDFLHKEGCLDRRGDHFACAPGKSRAMVVSIKRTSASIRYSIRYSIQFFLLSKCTSLVSSGVECREEKSPPFGGLFLPQRSSLHSWAQKTTLPFFRPRLNQAMTSWFTTSAEELHVQTIRISFQGIGSVGTCYMYHMDPYDHLSHC